VHALLLKTFNRYARLRGKDAIWVSTAAARFDRGLDEIVGGAVERLVTWRACSRLPPVVDAATGKKLTATDLYWSRHTVRGKTFLSHDASLDYIRELTDGRPLKRALLGLHGPHPGKVILDYGCGPGNDLAGFAEYSGAAKIIGVDISRKALELARMRVSWHARDPNRLVFIRVTDDDIRLPLDDGSVDYIQSLGVIHHASDPTAIFRELYRLLRPGAEARIMLYNADSVHVQLEVGYTWRLVNGVMTDRTPEQAFSAKADLGAPIAHCMRPSDVRAWIGSVPFAIDYLGGYFVPGEADNWRERVDRALADSRLSTTQRCFLSTLEPADGLPFFRGRPAGLGGVYVLKKADP
jgi:SAM-dependent methyltransferase